MEIGKLPVEALNQLIQKRNTSTRKDIVLRPQIGEDCGAIQFSKEICVVSTDPITATQSNIGFLSVNISCNDVIACGAECVAILVTLLAPPSEKLEHLTAIMNDIYKTCADLNIEVIGGHTEVTDAVNRIVVSTTAFGKADRVITSAGATVGDDIVLTKYCGIEGTNIIVNDYEAQLKDVLTTDEITFAKDLINKISVLKDGSIAKQFDIHAMHDVTDGGLLGALYEILECSQVGATIYEENIPLLPVTKKVCEHFNINPYRLIGSGSLIIITPNGNNLCTSLKSQGINACVIGSITDHIKTFVDKNNNISNLENITSDELYKLKKL